MRRATRLLPGWAGAMMLVALCSGCGVNVGNPEQGRDDFRQSRREAELVAEIATINAKLEDARQQLAQAQSLTDRTRQELLAEQNARRQEKLQHDLAVQQNFDMKNQLEQYRMQQQSNESYIKTLEREVQRFRQIVDRDEKDLASLRDEVRRLKEELAGLRPPAKP